MFLDIDNTLTSSVTRTIPGSAREAIARARERGVKVFAATGRNTRTPEEGDILKGLELDGYVAVNGQLCYLPDGTVVHCLPLAGEDVEAVHAFCRAEEIPLLVSERDCNYITRIDAAVREFHDHIKIPIYEERAVESLAGRVVLALSPFIGSAREKTLCALLRHSTTVRFNHINCDVIPLGGGKDVGMLKMLDYFGVPRERSLAMGDGGNDIAMLRAAGVGAAMAGSAPEVLAAADETAPSPDEDGIWKTFLRHGLL